MKYTVHCPVGESYIGSKSDFNLTWPQKPTIFCRLKEIREIFYQKNRYHEFRGWSTKTLIINI